MRESLASKKYPVSLWLMSGAILVATSLRFLLVEWQFIWYQLLVPPSPDLVAHARFIDQILAGEFVWTSYPPLFHALIALLAKLTTTSPLDVLLVIAPFWFLLVVPPFYLLAVRLIGRPAAVWATLISILVSLNPFTNFVDAQYPNILAYNIFGLLSLAYFVSGIREKRTDLWFGFGFLFLTGLTHHLSFVLLFLILGLSTLLYTIFTTNSIEKRYTRVILEGLIGIGLVGLIIFHDYAGGIIGATLDAILRFQPLISNQTGTVFDYADLGQVPAMLLMLGFVGCLMVFRNFVLAQEKHFGLLLLLVWVVVVWLLSRTSLSVVPQRIFRELNIPLAIAAGFVISDSLTWFRLRWQKILIAGLWGYIMLINTFQVFVPPFLLPDGFKYMSWFHPVDSDKLTYLYAKLGTTQRLTANSSNPILTYQLQRDGRQIKEVAIQTAALPNDARAFELHTADFIFIGILPPNVDPKTYFTSFVDYDTTTRYLGRYAERFGWVLVKQFDDGSKLYQNPQNQFARPF